MGEKVLPFAGYWVINGLILYLASQFWPGFVVFGNANIGFIVAVIWTGFVLTVAVSLVKPILDQFKVKVTKDYHLGLTYLLVNIVTLWVLARWLGAITGFGIGAFYVAIILGIIANLVQFGFWKFLLQKSGKKSS